METEEEEVEYDFEEQVYSCPMCDGDAYIMGTLGRRMHLMCRDCGMQFSLLKEG